MRRFAGFPAGSMKFTAMPNLFFSAVLPQIEDLAELKVTLHIFWILHQKKGFPRYVTLQELAADGTLIAGLKKAGYSAEGAIAEALRLAVARGTLLHLAIEAKEGKDEIHDVYFLNTAKGREVVRKLRDGEIAIGQIVRSSFDVSSPPKAPVERPNIFTLYEQNVGLLTPIIADELEEAERLYPSEWIEDAFRLAAGYNKRSWRYIRRILERWAIEGKSDEKDWRNNQQVPDQRGLWRGQTR
jgi:DnaD/phage-associated family protein